MSGSAARETARHRYACFDELYLQSAVKIKSTVGMSSTPFATNPSQDNHANRSRLAKETNAATSPAIAATVRAMAKTKSGANASPILVAPFVVRAQ
mgnify:CR=1 FL=1